MIANPIFVTQYIVNQLYIRVILHSGSDNMHADHLLQRRGFNKSRNTFCSHQRPPVNAHMTLMIPLYYP